MSNSKKRSEIYIVTSGDYSDYSIDGVYLSKSIAKEHAKRDRHAEVETHTVRYVAPKKMSQLTLTFHKKGNFHGDPPGLDPEFSYDTMCWPDDYERGAEVERNDEDFIRVIGFNHEKVRKIMGDLVARYKAEKAGIS